MLTHAHIIWHHMFAFWSQFPGCHSFETSMHLCLKDQDIPIWSGYLCLPHLKSMIVFIDYVITWYKPTISLFSAEETRQYLIWDREGEENTVDEVATQLFQAAERGLDGAAEEPQKQEKKKAAKKQVRSKKKDKKKKKRKDKSSSSSNSSRPSSSSSASSDGPSSDSESPQARLISADTSDCTGYFVMWTSLSIYLAFLLNQDILACIYKNTYAEIYIQIILAGMLLCCYCHLPGQEA